MAVRIIFKLLIISNYLQSSQLRSDAVSVFDCLCLKDISVNTSRIDGLLHRNFMLASALNPHIGYDRAAKIALTAHSESLSLKQTVPAS